MSRRSFSALVVAAAAVAAAAAAIRTVVRRRRPSAPARRELTCRCGQEYVVAGADRHRIFWRAGASEDDPVLGDTCPVCDAPLPAEPARV